MSSKSGSPAKSGNKPKRTKYDSRRVIKKIQKWKSASNIGEQPSTLASKLWKKVDKRDPEAVRRVLELHADGKGGDKDCIYFSSSRFWHTYKILKNEFLSYFYLSLWSVRLEAAHLSGNSILVGDDNCSIINVRENSFRPSLSYTLSHLDTVTLVGWYEKYYLLNFGKISLKDSTEDNRNSYLTNDSLDAEPFSYSGGFANELGSVEVQPPNDSDRSLEHSFNELGYRPNRDRPRFLYAEKSVIEYLPIGDRVIILLNVLSDAEYEPPLGWAFEPFTHTTAICIPLTLFEGLGVYEQVSLAQHMLTFEGDIIPRTADQSTETTPPIQQHDACVQTDAFLNYLRVKQELKYLEPPPINFDDNFNQIDNCKREHICDCLKCNIFLFEFLYEWELNTRTLYNVNEFNNFDDSGGYFSGGGNCNQYCPLTHCYFDTESRVAGRSVDMDRLSKSSPEISSDTTSSSSSSEGEGIIQMGGKYKTKKEKSPVIIITDEDYPTVVTHDAPTEPASPSVIIYDDEGIHPIVNLASSPIFAKTGRAARGEQKTMMKKDSSSYFTPPQATQNIADPDEFIKQIYFENVGVGLERINLDLILSRTTWGGAHDVLEAARVGQYHRIPTAQAAAAILRIMPIIATRASGGGSGCRKCYWTH